MAAVADAPSEHGLRQDRMAGACKFPESWDGLLLESACSRQQRQHRAVEPGVPIQDLGFREIVQTRSERRISHPSEMMLAQFHGAGRPAKETAGKPTPTLRQGQGRQTQTFSHPLA